MNLNENYIKLCPTKEKDCLISKIKCSISEMKILMQDKVMKNNINEKYSVSNLQGCLNNARNQCLKTKIIHNDISKYIDTEFSEKGSFASEASDDQSKNTDEMSTDCQSEYTTVGCLIDIT